jgi:hypothetical protein
MDLQGYLTADITDTDPDDWSLTTEQALFMLQHNNWFAGEDVEDARHLANLREYVELFGDMSIDEAIDRYECMIELGRN